MRVAYLVVGPEASGNRYLVDLLVSGGADGTGGHHQPFDAPDGGGVAIPSPRPAVIALCRSYPHAGRWPCVYDLVCTLIECGYRVIVLPVFRNPVYTALSQVSAGHAANDTVARLSVERATEKILSSCYSHAWEVVLVAYEWLADESYRHWLADRLGLKAFTLPFVDGNAKYANPP